MMQNIQTMQTMMRTMDTTTSVTTSTTTVGSNTRPHLSLGMERDVVFVAFPETGEEAAREYMMGAERFWRI